MSAEGKGNEIFLNRKMKKMKKIAKWCLAVLAACPLVLLFSEGADGGVTVWNYVGLAYAGAWIAWAYRRSRKLEEEERAFRESLGKR